MVKENWLILVWVPECPVLLLQFAVLFFCFICLDCCCCSCCCYYLFQWWWWFMYTNTHNHLVEIEILSMLLKFSIRIEPSRNRGRTVQIKRNKRETCIEYIFHVFLFPFHVPFLFLSFSVLLMFCECVCLFHFHLVYGTFKPKIKKAAATALAKKK